MQSHETALGKEGQACPVCVSVEDKKGLPLKFLFETMSVIHLSSGSHSKRLF